MNTSLLEGGVSVLQFHYLVATSQGIERFTERHELGLFSHEDYLAAYRESGLSVRYDPEGPIGRGLYVGFGRSHERRRQYAQAGTSPVRAKVRR